MRPSKAEKAAKAFVYVYSLNYKAEKAEKTLVYVYCWLWDPRNTHKLMLFLLFLLLMAWEVEGGRGAGVLVEPIRPSKADKAEIALVYVYSLNYKAEKALVYVCCWFPGPPNLYICMVLEGLGRREVPERTKGGPLLLQYTFLI